MAKNPVNWFEIYVDDIDRAKSFYQTVLATTLEKLDAPGDELEMWSFPGDQDGSGASGSIVKMGGVSAGGNSTIVYFSCDDCATEEARVEPSGGQVFKSKFSIGPYGFVALAIDSEGNMFGLYSMT